MIGRIATIVIHSRYTMHSKDKNFRPELSCSHHHHQEKKKAEEEHHFQEKRIVQVLGKNIKFSSYSTIFKPQGIGCLHGRYSKLR